MARLFDSYVMVDWSAASKPASGKDSIWIGVLAPDARLRLSFRSSNPETRAKAMLEIEEILKRLVGRGDKVLLGFDFPLGFPGGTSAKLGLPQDVPAWKSIRTFLGKEMKDKPDNANNRYALAALMNRKISEGPFPFWGCAKRDVLTTLAMKKTREHGPGDLAEYRLSEQSAIARKMGRPQPIWKIAYAGAVGGQALTGIPAVDKLRAKFEGMRIWPFEAPMAPLTADGLDGVDVVACEIYPSMLATEARDNELKDEAQVRIIAEHFAQLDESGRLGAAFSGPKDLSDSDKAVISAEEGWILGV